MTSLGRLVDLQINGWGGTNFSDPDSIVRHPGALRACRESIWASGTCAFLATVTSMLYLPSADGRLPTADDR